MLTHKTLDAQSNEFNTLVRKSEYTNSNEKPLTHEQGLRAALNILYKARDSGGNVYVIGNGGSAAVASHITTDFCNVCELRAMTLHEPSVLTCFSNDFGYENGFAKRLEKMLRREDVLVAISSSGQSKNILNAVDVVNEFGATVITLSGFLANNPLRRLGELNYWINSHEYGLVEIGHLFGLHHWSDCIGFESKRNKEIA